jgi:hypothetical protein
MFLTAQPISHAGGVEITLCRAGPRLPASPSIRRECQRRQDFARQHWAAVAGVPIATIGCQSWRRRQTSPVLNAIGIAPGLGSKDLSATEMKDLPVFGAQWCCGWVGRNVVRKSGVRHATFSNRRDRRPICAHPLFSCWNGAERCRAARGHPQYALAVA